MRVTVSAAASTRSMERAMMKMLQSTSQVSSSSGSCSCSLAAAAAAAAAAQASQYAHLSVPIASSTNALMIVMDENFTPNQPQRPYVPRKE